MTKQLAASPTLNGPAGAGITGFSHDTDYDGGKVGHHLKQQVFVTDEPFSADPTGATDSTPAHQAAEDYALTFAALVGSVNAPVVHLPPGLYNVGAISKVSFGWQGAGPNNTHLLYNGAAGDDFITQDVVDGSNSAGLLAGMSLDGNDCGSILKMPVNVAGYGVDDRFRIENIRFYRGTTQLDLSAGWVNAHFRYLRFDNWNDCAILLTPYAGQNQASFRLTDFTCDNSSGGYATATANCFCRIDLSAYSTTGNVGIITFESARVEFNNHALAGNKAVFEILAPLTGSRQAEIVLRDITVQNTFAGGVSSLFYRSAGGATTHAERYALWNVQTNGIGSFLFAGDYPAWMLAIPSGNWLMLVGDDINGFVGLRTLSSGATGLEFFGPATNTVVSQIKLPTESFARVQQRPDVLLSGTGAVAPTVILRFGGKTGWGVPTGTFSRATFASYTAGVTLTYSAAYVQAEQTATGTRLAAAEAALQTLSRTVAALINDLHGSGASSPHGFFRT